MTKRRVAPSDRRSAGSRLRRAGRRRVHWVWQTALICVALVLGGGWITATAPPPTTAAPVREINQAEPAAIQGGCNEQETAEGTAENWGSIGTVAAAASCEPTPSERDDVANWGYAATDTLAIHVTIGDGSESVVVAIDEGIAQAAGEIGITTGDTLTGEVGAAGDDTLSVDVVVGDQTGRPPDQATGVSIASPTDPNWANVNQWNDEVVAAQQQVYQEIGILVPANVVKAVMKIESNGVLLKANYAGARGLMQVTPMSMGSDHYDFQRLETEAAYSIYCGVYELALRYRHSGERPWRNVIVGYFTGHYDPTGAADRWNDDFQYQQMFDTYMEQLEAAATVTVAGRNAPLAGAAAAMPGNWLAGQGQTIAGLSAIWGNVTFGGAMPALSQEFGPTNFSVNVHPEWYSYSRAYGFVQGGHTGLDVGTPANTPLYAPADATVVCAGTGNGNGEDGCAAFTSSYGGPTSGRLQLKLDGGDMLILGHVNSCTVSPGQRVKAGQQVGFSGGMNGDHVHLEYRIKDSTVDAGWRIIDPRLTPLNYARVEIQPSSAPPPAPSAPQEPPPSNEPPPPAPPSAPAATETAPEVLPPPAPTEAPPDGCCPTPTPQPEEAPPPTEEPLVPTEPPPEMPTAIPTEAPA